jgi:pyruvate/2-oxoglutarate/acetoin dehydrogenase E1 component
MRELSFADAINEAIREEMQRDHRVFVQGEDVGPYGGGYFPALKGLWDDFGAERVRDFPISETAIVGTALGAAMTGLRPVVDIMFADFAFVCFDQIVNQVAKMRYMSGGVAQVPLVLRGAFGGYQHLAAQHSHSMEALFCQFPGLVVVVPSGAKSAKGLLKAAIRSDDPVVFLEHKMLYQSSEQVPDDSEFLLPLGRADVARDGTDVTLVAHGYMTQLALQAADALFQDGISAEVVDLWTLSPLDGRTILSSVHRTRRVVAIQEAPPSCGIAAEIVAVVAESGADMRAPPQRVTGEQAPIPFSPVLESAVLPQVEDIVETARLVMA